MAGFGSGSFGRGSFGRWPWATHVLWTTLPALYREADAAQDYAYSRWVASVSPLVESQLDRIAEFDTLHDPETVRSAYHDVRSMRLGRVTDTASVVEQRGAGGFVGVSGEVILPGRFNATDAGKVLVVLEAAVPANVGTYRVALAVDSTTLIVEPFLTPEAGPLRWELRSEPVDTQDTTTVEVRQGDLRGVEPGWVLTDGDTEYTVRARREYVRATDVDTYTLRQGQDGVLAAGVLTTPTGRFVPADTGRPMRVWVAGESAVRAWIRGVLSATQVELVDTEGVALGSESLVSWAVMPFPELTLVGDVRPKGVVLQAGIDAVLTPITSETATLRSATARFTSADVGRFVWIRSPTDPVLNNTRSVIETVVSANEVQVRALEAELAPVPIYTAATGVAWEVREPTGVIPSRAVVQVRAPSLLEELARDFGIEVDRREPEAVQRLWVRSWAQWINAKGTTRAYQILGAITGAEVGAASLYRITQEVAALVPADALVELREFEAGRLGVFGAFAGRLFSTDEAVFQASDAGRQLRIRGASVAANSRWYTIEAVLSSTQVQVRALDTPIEPEAASGFLEWGVCRLYTTLAPIQAAFDEVAGDVFKVAIDGYPAVSDDWGLDRWGWELGYRSSVPVTLVSQSPITKLTSELVLAGPLTAIGLVGRWRLVIGTSSYWIETLPEAVGPNWRVTVTSGGDDMSSLVGMPTQLEYVPGVQLACDYCQSRKILLDCQIEPSATAREDSLDFLQQRLLDRLTQAKPAHVDFIPRFRTVLEATVGWSAEVEPSEVAAPLMASLSYYFDETPADLPITTEPTPVYPTDLGLGAEVES